MNIISNNCHGPIKKCREYTSEYLKKRKVVNMSGLPLSDSETSILSKGLNFCPTPIEMKKQQFYYEVDNFKRNLSLKVFFYKENDHANTHKNEPYKSTVLEKIV